MLIMFQTELGVGLVMKMGVKQKDFEIMEFYKDGRGEFLEIFILSEKLRMEFGMVL